MAWAGAYGGAQSQVFHPPVPPLSSTPCTHPLRLTLVSELKANVRVALVSGEEEVEVVAGADEELGDLGPVVNPNQGSRVCSSISHFQSVIVNLSFKSAKWRQWKVLEKPKAY
jgi:hypothetical protein